LPAPPPATALKKSSKKSRSPVGAALTETKPVVGTAVPLISMRDCAPAGATLDAVNSISRFWSEVKPATLLGWSSTRLKMLMASS